MELTRTEQMLIQAIKAALCGRQVDWTDTSPQELDELMRLSLQHKLQPLVLQAVYGCPAAKSWASLEQNRKLAKAQVMAQAAKTAEFLALYQALCDADCPPLVVKGILCRELYPNGDLRQSGDEDLFAAPQQFSDCCAELRQNGFTPLRQADEDAADEIGWQKQGSPLRIELHRNLFPQSREAVKEFQDFFANVFETQKTYLLQNGAAVLSMPEHDHLLYLLLHAYKHFIRGGFGIRQVCDIGLWAKAHHERIDWPELYAQCRKTNTLKFSAAVFRLAQQELKIEFSLPEEWKQEIDYRPLLQDVLAAGIYGSIDRNRAHSASVTQNAVSAKQTGKSSSVLRSVFPPKQSLCADYPILERHGIVLPAIWVKRLLRYRRETKRSNAADASETVRLAQQRKKLLKYYGIL